LGVSATGGYIAGQKQRDVGATQTTVVEIDQQFALGVSDLDAGRYNLAAERFRWVLQRRSDYPGAADRLAAAEQQLISGQATSVPTLPPSTSDDPTELFAEASGYFEREEWANAISRLEQVQTIDPTYRDVDVKEMLYKAYSTLGLGYIRGDRIEEGLFLLDLAEQIRPLDDLTGGERYLASLYSTGQTYWGLDWNVVIRNFEAILPIAPTYRDVSARLREAYVRFGDQLVARNAACDAVTQYENALALAQDDAVEAKRDAAAQACTNPSPLATATPLGSTNSTPGSNATQDGSEPLNTATPLYNIP
jgi:tetratricopeptide (TPR) repeat protein